MHKSPSAVLLRSVEDLADAKELRSVISAVLASAPVDEQALRCAVWSFVGVERRAGVPPALIITRLTSLIDEVKTASMASHLTLTKKVILWCVEEYFGHLGGNVLENDESRSEASR
jgi:hypothetical protein